MGFILIRQQGELNTIKQDISYALRPDLEEAKEWSIYNYQLIGVVNQRHQMATQIILKSLGKAKKAYAFTSDKTYEQITCVEAESLEKAADYQKEFETQRLEQRTKDVVQVAGKFYHLTQNERNQLLDYFGIDLHAPNGD